MRADPVKKQFLEVLQKTSAEEVNFWTEELLK